LNNRNLYRRKNKKIPARVLIPVIILCIVVGLLMGIWLFIASELGADNEQPNMTEISYFQHIGLLPNQIIVIGDEIFEIDYAPIFTDNTLYIPADFLRSHVDRHIFWEANTNRLTITNSYEVVRFNPENPIFTVNWQEYSLDNNIRRIGDMAYVPAELVMQRYPVHLYHSIQYALTVLDFTYNQQLIYQAVLPVFEDEAIEAPIDLWAIRTGPSNQHPIIGWANLDDLMTYFGLYEDYLRVRLQSGIIGYIHESHVIFSNIIEAVEYIAEPRRPITRTFDHPQNVLWHQVSNATAAANSAAWYRPLGVDVMSPSWFTFDTSTMNGDIIDIGNHEYVEWAHSHGMEVWPKITDNFDRGVSYMALSNAYIRDHVINQLMHFIEYYNLDGINVDYEEVHPHFADEWIQFLRELSVPMRQAGSVLSVAVFVPAAHNMFWNRYEIGHAVDYLLIMAYDEHWATSIVAGPVASHGFVHNAIVDTLSEVPASQVMLGLPFFVRIWREEFPADGQEPQVRQHRAVGMQFARDYFEAHGAEFTWDYIVRKYYANFTQIENGLEVRYRVWLEDIRSIQEKLDLFAQYGLAGVAGWRKGLELAEVWELIYEYTRASW